MAEDNVSTKPQKSFINEVVSSVVVAAVAAALGASVTTWLRVERHDAILIEHDRRLEQNYQFANAIRLLISEGLDKSRTELRSELERVEARREARVVGIEHTVKQLNSDCQDVREHLAEINGSSRRK